MRALTSHYIEMMFSEISTELKQLTAFFREAFEVIRRCRIMHSCFNINDEQLIENSFL